jgi:hypothetical protein
MAVRSFGSNLQNDETQEKIRFGLWKEINAGRNVFSEGSMVGYGVFNNGESQSIPGTPNTPRWVRQATNYVERLSQNLSKLHVVYPKLQRIRNLSRTTCENLDNAGYKHLGREVNELTSLDLEKFYAETGIQIQGECEMRTAWRFNDLKPRVYYCQGGTMYWPSRYMRPIADIFMNAWPMTHRERRSYPDSISRFLDPDETIIYWDMESFTSTLSELKYFLFWIARYLENDPYMRQHPIKLFDYHRGVIEVNIWEMLDTYNEKVNMYGEYTVERQRHVLAWMDEVTPIIVMMNNGPLGVLGNIGFSTTEHSVHSGVVLDQNKGVGVGDDHLGLAKKAEEMELMKHMSRIGKIHPAKIGRIHPVCESDPPGLGKFLKRGMRRYHDYFQLDILFHFPILAYTRDRNIPGRTVDLSDRSRAEHKLAGQVGSFLWSLCDLGHLTSTSELKIVGMILRVVYKMMGWSIAGHLPGRKGQSGEVIRVCIPPIDFTVMDPREEDWAEYLWTASFGQYVKMSMKTDYVAKPEAFYVNDIIVIGQTRFTKALEDIGVFKKVRGWSEYIEVTETNRRLFKKMLGDQGSFIVEYRCVRSPPFEFMENLFTYRLLSVQSDCIDRSMPMYGKH